LKCFNGLEDQDKKITEPLIIMNKYGVQLFMQKWVMDTLMINQNGLYKLKIKLMKMYMLELIY